MWLADRSLANQRTELESQFGKYTMKWQIMPDWQIVEESKRHQSQKWDTRVGFGKLSIDRLQIDTKCL